MTTDDIYEDTERLVECDNCLRRVNIEDSRHGTCSSGESRQCWLCMDFEPLWHQFGLPQPTWETHR